MLYKQLYKAAIPADAKRTTKKGVQYASWVDRYGRRIKAEVKIDPEGNEYATVPSHKWYARYTDSAGRTVQRCTNSPDKDAAAAVLNGWKRVTEKVRAGHLRRDAEHVKKTGPLMFEDVQAEFLEALRRGWSKRRTNTRPASASHLYYTKHVLDTFRTERRVYRLIDFTLKAGQKHLDGLQDNDKSARTQNYQRAILSGFGNYCYFKDYLPDNPVEKATIADVEQDKRRTPRALTDKEVVKLLDTAEARPLQAFMENNRGCVDPESVKPETVDKLKHAGRQRRLIYHTLVSTGLRWGELRGVRVCDLDLDDPHINLPAKITKSKRAEVAVFTDKAVVDQLRQWLKDTERFGAVTLFDMPTSGIVVFDRDIEAAEIKKTTQDGTACVHSLRHTTATRCARAGVPPVILKDIMRHSDIKITMKYYTHLKLHDLHGAIQALPPLTGTTTAADAAEA